MRHHDAARLAFAAKADRMFLPILWLLLLFSLGLSSWHDTLELALLAGLPLALVPSALITLKPGAFVTRIAVAVALMLFCALNIHQARGMAELHFGIFVALAFLLCYQDWRVIIAAALVAAIHHLSFNYLQQWGYGFICFTDPGLGIVLIHAAYVVAEAAVLSYLSVVLSRETTRASRSGQELLATLDSTRATSNSVRLDVESISAASREIAIGSANLSTRSEMQACGLKAAAGSMEQLTGTVRQNAANLAQAGQLITSASGVAEKGGEVIARVVETMTAIKGSSHRIVDIIGLIDGVAFQTNILALNAAVEAARAGEQGRGFAVVATEVRALAQRSASAAKDIKTLIETTVREVEAGGALVDEAGDTIGSIVTSVRRAAGIMGDIANAGQEQSQEISQLSHAISQMDEMTQQNARLVEQTAAAAKSLHSHAAHVSNAMSAFGEGNEVSAAMTAETPERHFSGGAAARLQPAPA